PRREADRLPDRRGSADVLRGRHRPVRRAARTPRAGRRRAPPGQRVGAARAVRPPRPRPCGPGAPAHPAEDVRPDPLGDAPALLPAQALPRGRERAGAVLRARRLAGARRRGQDPAAGRAVGRRVTTAVATPEPAVEGETRGVELLLRFARAGHDAGYSTAELEERVVAVADAVGVDHVEVSVTPTLVELSLGALSQQQTHSLRVRPARVDLGKIAALDELVQDLLDGRMSPDDALAALAVPARERPAVPLGRLAAYAGAGLA